MKSFEAACPRGDPTSTGHVEVSTHRSEHNCRVLGGSDNTVRDSGFGTRDSGSGIRDSEPHTHGSRIPSPESDLSPLSESLAGGPKREIAAALGGSPAVKSQDGTRSRGFTQAARRRQYSSSLPHHVSAVDADAGLERDDHGADGTASRC